MKRDSSEISDEKMEYYRKRFQLKRIQVRVDDICAKKSRVSNESGHPNSPSDDVHSRTLNAMENRVLSLSDSQPTTTTVDEMFDDDSEIPVVWMEDANYDTDNVERTPEFYEERFRIMSDLQSGSVRLPVIRTGELKGGVPVVKVDGEIIRVSKEVKEQIDENNRIYQKPDTAEKKSKICSENRINSVSTFIEREDKSLTDRAYFQVLSAEICGENEINICGIYILDEEF